MKKVLFFLESLAGGGAERILTDIVCHLDKSKYDITVYTVTDGDVYQPQVCQVCRYHSFLNTADFQSGGIRKLLFWLKLKMIYTLPAKFVYKRLIHGHYDIEIAFIEGFATKLIAASSNTASKKVAWIHTDFSVNSNADRCYQSLAEESAAYRKYDRILCVSNSVKQSFVQKFFSTTNLYVQYNPINEANIIRLSHEPINLHHPVHSPLLVTVGRLEQQKGYLRLLQCAKRLHNEGHLFTLWIIGQGSQMDTLSKFIRENDLEHTVQLLGFHKNPYKYIKQCDAFICTSFAEGFSTAATESLILGKPVFTVECAGMRELLGDSHAGEIVPNTDNALYHLLSQLVTNQFNMSQYIYAAKARGQSFCMSARISEIDQMLSSL